VTLARAAEPAERQKRPASSTVPRTLPGLFCLLLAGPGWILLRTVLRRRETGGEKAVTTQSVAPTSQEWTGAGRPPRPLYHYYQWVRTPTMNRSALKRPRVTLWAMWCRHLGTIGTGDHDKVTA